MADAFNETLQWTFGLRNSAGKYLTQEQFQFKLNANGPSLKPKQTWTIEQEATAKDGDPPNPVFFKSWGKRYLQATERGVVSLEEDKGRNAQWTIEAQADGRWAIKSAHGYYFTGSGDDIKAFAKTPDEKWTVHLANHPQVVLRSTQRKAYAHIDDKMQSELTVNELIPWGVDALINMEFQDGRYSLRSSSNKFLSASGKLQDALDDKCKFILVFTNGKVAFKTSDGKFLEPVGPGTLKGNKSSLNAKVQFEIEDSHPQVVLTSAAGIVNNKQSLELRASKNADFDDLCIFQMEIDKKTDKWSFRNHSNKYWQTGATGGIVADKTSPEFFEIEWHGAHIAIKSDNGKYVSTTTNGKIAASAASVGDSEKFVFELINRPQIALRGPHGFLATKSGGKLSCNNSVPVLYTMTCNKGKYSFKGDNGKFFQCSGDGVSVAGASAEEFTIELLKHSKLAVKTASGTYLTSEQNGTFKAGAAKAGNNELFEF